MPALAIDRRGAIAAQRQGMRTVVRSQPAPIGGLNLRDPIDDMPPTDALVLKNWIVDFDGLVIRPGYASHATGVGAGDVETLAAFESGSASKLIAAGDGELYNASSTGAASAITSAANYTSDRWQTIMFNNRLFGCNGSDSPWDYNGTTVSTTAWTSGPADNSKLINVWSHVQRVWFAEEDSASAWYAAVGAVTGTLSEFDLSQIARRGGKLQAGGAWSRDGGDGLEDLQVFVMSTGEVIVYQGTDPSTAANWVKVGSYDTAPPIGRRCLTKIGGDLVLITRAGYLPISLIMQGLTPDAIAQSTTWGKIAPLVRDEAALHAANWGWQASPVFPNGRVYFNYPPSTALWEQHALNTQRGAWSVLDAIPARCWAVFNNEVYFGGGGGVVNKHSGTDDGGASITVDAKTAFTYFGDRGSRKQVTAVRPVMQVDGTLTAGIVVNTNFSDRNAVLGSATIQGFSDGSAWDDPLWDEGDWADVPEPDPRWITEGGDGLNVGVRLRAQTTASPKWFSTDYLLKAGGVR